MEQEIAVHPVQAHSTRLRRDEQGQAPIVVTMAAYEVYCHVYAPQADLIQGSCRGGFGVGELIALLYARSFPKDEWRKRVDEALTGLKV